MPRYVILTHDHPFPHWDLLLESGAACRTWRLLGEPQVGSVVAAEPLSDHRLHYLDYEGPVSGGRGAVARWDWGTYTITLTENSALVVQLVGRRSLAWAELQEAPRGTCWAFRGDGPPGDPL